MRSFSLLTSLGAAALASFACACTVTSTTNTVVGDDAASSEPDANTVDANSPDAATSDANTAVEAAPDGSDDGGGGAANIRFAAWSPDSPPFDVCFAPHGTGDYGGPQLAPAFAQAPNDAGGGFVGLAFPTVTVPLQLDPGQADVRIVAAGAADCSSPILEATNLPALADGSNWTLALVGDANPAGSDPKLGLVAIANDAVPTSGTSLLRFINASPGVPVVDFGSGTLNGEDFDALFTGVAFGQSGSQADCDSGTVDSNGYVEVSPIANAVLSAHASTAATSDTASAANVSLAAEGVVSVVLINGKTGSTGANLLVCNDNDSLNYLNYVSSLYETCQAF